MRFGHGLSRMSAAAGIVLLVSSSAWATPVVIDGVQNVNVQSSFFLDFGFGITREADISSTNYSLELDDQPSGVGFAQFLSYNQSVESIGIPNSQGGPDIQTGQLTITILPGTSTGGTYNPATGVFTTGETYRIQFTENLEPLGFPGNQVDFPSTSSGIVYFETPTSGTIHQRWEGRFESLNLDYVCEVNTVFGVPEPASLSLLGMGAVGLLLRRRR